MTHRDSEVSTLLRRCPPVLALAALATLASTAGCGGGDTPPLDTYVNASVRPAVDSNNNNLCNVGSSTQALLIGMQGTNSMTSPATVQDGTSSVNIVCTVLAGFNVDLLALSMANMKGGSLSVQGNVDSTSHGTNIAAQLSSDTAADSFSASNCTLTPTYLNGTIPTSPPIAPGRIWSHLSCPQMPSTSGKSKVINGAAVTETCDVEADFLFENCSQ